MWLQVVTEPLLGLFPSMASFFFLHIVHRKGPSHRLDAEEMIGPPLFDKPSAGDSSVWHTAHFKSPVSVFEGRYFPNLHFKTSTKTDNQYLKFSVNPLNMDKSLSVSILG